MASLMMLTPQDEVEVGLSIDVVVVPVEVRVMVELGAYVARPSIVRSRRLSLNGDAKVCFIATTLMTMNKCIFVLVELNR